MTLILGIDIGASGAIALLTRESDLVEVADMPVLQDGPKGRRAVNPPLLASIVFKSHPDHAFVEYVGAGLARDRLALLLLAAQGAWSRVFLGPPVSR